MGILTKEVEVKPTGKMIQYYKNKGYDAKYKQPLIVKVEDLPKSSFMPVSILCDYCKEEVFSTTYHHYNEESRHISKHACKNCWQKKNEEVVMMKYGVKSVSQVEEFQKKREQTLQANYGVPVPLKSKEIKNKQVQTVIDTYGVTNVSQLEEVKMRKMKTTLENFGVENPSKSEEVKEKIRSSCIEKYGCENPMQSLEIRAKANETLCKNGSQKTSKQQLYLHLLYGGGHDLRVALGRLTQEEFDQKEIIRNSVLKKEGYKIIRIKSKSDKLPSDSILLQMLTDARNYFSEYPNHSWIEFSIDTSLVRNAENKQGVHYDFGNLRRIKDEDLNDISNIETEQTTTKKGA